MHITKFCIIPCWQCYSIAAYAMTLSTGKCAPVLMFSVDMINNDLSMKCQQMISSKYGNTKHFSVRTGKNFPSFRLHHQYSGSIDSLQLHLMVHNQAVVSEVYILPDLACERIRGYAITIIYTTCLFVHVLRNSLNELVYM